MSVEIPAVQEADLQFLNEYVKNGSYKNFLKVNSYDSITEAFSEVKSGVDQATGQTPDENSLRKFNLAAVNAFTLKRDFISRYASRITLKAAALDKKMYFDSFVKARWESLESG